MPKFFLWGKKKKTENPLLLCICFCVAVFSFFKKLFKASLSRVYLVIYSNQPAIVQWVAINCIVSGQELWKNMYKL